MDNEVIFSMAGGADPVERFAKKFAALDPVAVDLQQATQYLAEKTRSNALSGIDFRGTQFAPYSPLYAKQKGDSHVDLYGRTSGPHMLDAVEGRVVMDPASIEVGIFDNPELAKRAAIHQRGVTFSGSRASKFIGSLVHRSRQKVAGLKRRLKNQGNITVIPSRKFLGVTRQDLQVMSELVRDSIMRRFKGE